MAEFSYASYAKYEQSRSTNSANTNLDRVGYFNSLKDDGDEAVVRFMYTSPEEFNLATVHNVKVGDKWKKIACNRTPFEPVEKCALCDNGEKPTMKFYVKLIDYVRNDSGEVVPKAKIWERPASFAATLKSYFEEYGNISESVFKIKRRGAKGNLQTTYDIIYANPNIYKAEIYTAPEAIVNQLKNIDLSKHSYFVKSNEDMLGFLMTGEFSQTTPQTTPVETPKATPVEPVVEKREPVVQTNNSIDDSLLARPRRTYNY